jgi:hypothetical protein
MFTYLRPFQNLMPLHHARRPLGILLATRPNEPIRKRIHSPVRVHIDLLARLDIIVVWELICVDF